MRPHSTWQFLAGDKIREAGQAPARERVSCTKAELVPNKDMEFSMTEMFLLGSAKPKI